MCLHPKSGHICQFLKMCITSENLGNGNTNMDPDILMQTPWKSTGYVTQHCAMHTYKVRWKSE